MRANRLPDKLDSAEVLARHLGELAALDPELEPVIRTAGPFGPRITTPGFAGMARIICGQQLSVASARAIWSRYEALEGALDPQGFLMLEESLVRAAGMSLGKCRTLRVVAEAVAVGDLDFGHAQNLPAEEAVAYLTRLKGIGPWTAEIYLMFCAGHPDIFPAGDLALQKSVAHALKLQDRPKPAMLAEIAARWVPYRASAALLFWRYYAAIREKEGIAL